MTPPARVAAAIGIIDRVLAGMAAEQALTNWARASRFAGSGDRAAVRDLVFDAVRCRRSFAALGGGESGRELMIGAMRAAGQDPASVFTGQGHAPAAVQPGEGVADGLAPLVALDCPDWLGPLLQQSLGAAFGPVMGLLRQRAPVFLRANLARTTVALAIGALADDGIVAVPHPLARTALQVTQNARKIQTGQAYLQGLVELQDAGSQAILEGLPLAGRRVLDYCAGGGGKALAMAAAGALVWAYDADTRRMRDLAVRAARAGVRVPVFDQATGQAPFDLVLVDAPCSGSGSWRRSPEGKWALTPQRLAGLIAMQAEILDVACHYVAQFGHLAYVTCSLLEGENQGQVQAFLSRHREWRLAAERRLTPLDGGDGFYLAHLTRE